MEERTYRNFELRIDRTDAGYHVSAKAPDGSEADGDFAASVATNELGNAAQGIWQLEPGVQRDFRDNDGIQTIQKFGTLLFETVFGTEVRARLRSSLDRARHEHTGLRIQLNLTNAPDLADLPWEYLCDPSDQSFFARSRVTSLVRFLSLGRAIQSVRIKLPLQMLVVIASPGGYETLDMDAEWKRLQAALNDLEESGLLTVKRLNKATVDALGQELLQSQYHIMHFIGHGGFERGSDSGYIVLENEAGGPAEMDASQLADLLADRDSLHLVILNVCEGARASPQDPFAGLAQSLVRRGIPAVIAMQSRISDPVAIAFAETFFRAVAAGYPVDASVAEARINISVKGYDAEWGMPVLYLRTPDGRIFPFGAEERRHMQIEALTTRAQAAMNRDAWDAAIIVWGKLLEIDANNVAAQEGQELATLYRDGIAAYTAGKWREAETAMAEVQRISANYKQSFKIQLDARRQLGQVPSSPTAGFARGLLPPIAAANAESPLEQHFREVLSAMSDNRLILLLGTDVNQCGRPGETVWTRGQQEYPPSGHDVAAYLAAKYKYVSPIARDLPELVQVSQYVSIQSGPTALYQGLHTALDADYLPTPLHRLIATLPATLRERGYRSYPLIITANYDDVLERAFQAEGEPFDVVSYVKEGDDRGVFRHQPYGEKARPIKQANRYFSLPLDSRAVIVRIYGAINRNDPTDDTYVVTEDQYIDYLAREKIEDLVPVQVLNKLKRSALLFLGLNLRGWHLRVLPRRIWGSMRLENPSWAVLLNPQQADQVPWPMRDVDLLPLPLDDYVAELSERVQNLPLADAGG